MLKALLLVSCLALAAAPPPAKTPVAPLQPGEALALSGPDGQVYLFGDASTELPMGGLAKLVWLKMEGSEWGAMNLSFNCTGALKADRCWLPKGHGRLDLGKALAEDCDLAFLAWGQASVQWWLRDYGEGAARARLEDAFGPFLGRRMPGGEDLPVIDAPWVGMGDLLRTSPAGVLEVRIGGDVTNEPGQIDRLLSCRPRSVFETGKSEQLSDHVIEAFRFPFDTVERFPCLGRGMASGQLEGDVETGKGGAQLVRYVAEELLL